MKGMLLSALVLFCFAFLAAVDAKGQPICGGAIVDGCVFPKEAPPKTKFPSDKDEKFTPVDCTNLAKHRVSDDGTSCIPTGKCPFFPNPFYTDPDCTKFPIRTVLAIDPNDKTGPPGATNSRFLGADVPLQYALFFENEASASAPAQRVVVTDQLDPATMDLETLSLGPISFGETIVNPPPGLTHYAAGIDLRPSQNIIVRIDAGLDKTGLLSWTFTSIDPATLQLTTDPFAGFLPPNSVPPAGQGSVQFTVMPKSALATGTVIRNQAAVVFDINAPINTPVWSNTIDNSPPVTRVLPLAANQSTTSFPVRWSGTDQGSGLLAFTVFVSDNGGAFAAWQDQTTATSATFVGQAGHQYGFYSIGRDLVANLEAAKAVADATTQVGTVAVCASDVSSQVQITRSGFGYNLATGRFAQTVTLKNTGSGVIVGPISLALDKLSSNATLFNPIGTTVCALPAGSPYVNFVGNLNPGASASIAFQFANPTRAGISYATRVLAGSATR